MSSLLAGLLVVLGAVDIAPSNSGASLTLPSQHHMVRIVPPGGPPTWLVAMQQRGAQGNGLGFFKSTNEGQSWSYVGPIQDDWTEPDNADLIVVGSDIALIYSFETYSSTPITGSTRHDVVFQWWRYSADNQTWEPDPPVTVFNSTSSSTAFYRSQFARDSLGRFWVMTFKLEANGSSSVIVAASSDNGESFPFVKTLVTGLPLRGGGTINSINGKLLVLFDQNGDPGPARSFVRDDGDPLGTWGSEQVALSDGIYHGAALSTANGGGLMHLVYKNDAEQLYYRSFNGNSFSDRILIDNRADWAMQPALTYVGNTLYVFWNHQRNPDSFELRLQKLVGGSFTPYTVVNGVVSWKGYLTAAAFLPNDAPQVLCAYGNMPNASTAGTVQVISVSRGTGPVVDAGVPDAGHADAGSPGGGTVDAGPPPSGLLFTDNFNRPNAPNLGSNWKVQLGAWQTQNSEAQSELTTPSLAAVSAPDTLCSDCVVEARVVGFGVPSTALFLRESLTAPFDRYEAAITGSNQVEIRRIRSGTTTVVGSASTGLLTLSSFATLSLQATGSNPVHLVARINGAVRLDLNDSSGQALSGPGAAGLSTNHAGVVFDDFSLKGTGSLPPPPPGGTFSDDFNRSTGLGTNWNILSGEFGTFNNQAQTDLNLLNLALENPAACANCTVSAQVVGFGVPETSLVLRSSPDGVSRYEAVLTGSKTVVVRRISGGVTTVLGTASAGVSDLSSFHALALAASGSGPVTLTVSVDGVGRLTVVDGSGAITSSGHAGIASTHSGVVFDQFRLQ